jgi:hypothetical protein
METGIGIEGKWAVDAPPSLTLALARRLDIADKLAGERWRLVRDEDGGMTGQLRRGPVRVVLMEDKQTDQAGTLRYQLSVKRFGITITAEVEMDCHPDDGGGSVVAIRFRFNDSGVLRFVPRGAVDQRLFSFQQAFLLTYEQALEALSADRQAALAKLSEADRELLLSCLPQS